MTKIAVVQVRGPINLDKKRKDTLKMLKLVKKNSCVLIDNRPTYWGMLEKLKDYLTWGEVEVETVKLLLEKRARIMGNKQLSEDYMKDKSKFGFAEFASKFIEGGVKFKDVPGMKPFFRLKPPKGGFERGGIKKPFSLGGALGYRKEKINDLIKRMI